MAPGAWQDPAFHVVVSMTSIDYSLPKAVVQYMNSLCFELRAKCVNTTSNYTKLLCMILAGTTSFATEPRVS